MTRTEILEVAKPILFSTEMVRAIQDGRKTVTRRRIKQSVVDRFMLSNDGRLLGSFDDKCYDIYPTVDDALYQVDDILYVRETWGIGNFDYDNDTAYIIYKASENEKEAGCQEIKLPEDKFEKLYNSMAENSPEWRPSIHMPKEAARIFLRVTGVRVERLQDISDKDFIREGIEPYIHIDGSFNREATQTAYVGIWNSTVKKSDLSKYGWDANPWVWVIEFERVEVE